MQFRRAKRDRWLLGVCGGLAHSQGWNPNVVRLVTAVLAVIVPGVSVIPLLVVYVLLGWLLPESEEF